VEGVGPPTVMEGTEGVTEIDGTVGIDEPRDKVGATDKVGVSLIENVGRVGGIDMDGGFTLEPFFVGLTMIDGISWIAIVGMGGFVFGLECDGGAWEKFIVGMGGVAIRGVSTFHRVLAVGSGLAGGSS
jgi:hypothetical protein